MYPRADIASSSFWVFRLGRITTMAGAIMLVALAAVSPVMAQQSEAADDHQSCNCDVRLLVDQLAKNQALRAQLERQKAAKAADLVMVQQKLLSAALTAGSAQDPEYALTSAVAWTSLSLLMDFTLDQIDGDLFQEHQQIVSNLDLFGGGKRGLKVAAEGLKKGVAKSGKAAKAFFSNAPGGSNAALSQASDAFGGMQDLSAKIDSLRVREGEIWQKLLSEECSTRLTDICVSGNPEQLDRFDLEDGFESVAVPRLMTPMRTDRALSEELFPKGYLKSELDQIRAVLERTDKLDVRAYRLEMLSKQYSEVPSLSIGSCPACKLLENLNALTRIEARVRLLQIEWRRDYLGQLQTLIGGQRDLVKLWSQDTKGAPREVTSHPAFKLISLATALYSPLNPVGTAMSVADATSEVSQAVGNYVFKRPVAEEIKSQTRMMQLYADGLRGAMDRLESAAEHVRKGKTALLSALQGCEEIKECPAPRVIFIQASRKGQVLFEWHEDNDFPSTDKKIGPGPLALTIRFSTDMDQSEPADIKVRNYGKVEGRWRGPRRWGGVIEVPAGDDMAALAGHRTISVEAVAENWRELTEQPTDPGTKRLSQDAQLHFGSDRPSLSGVRVTQGRKPFYEPKNGVSKALVPGLYRLTLSFDQPMLDEISPDVSLLPPRKEQTQKSIEDFESFTRPAKGNQSPLEISGQWRDEKTWIARFVIEPEMTEKAAGLWTLSVQAANAAGQEMDSAPTEPGEQPDRTHRLKLGEFTVLEGVVSAEEQGPLAGARVILELGDKIWKKTTSVDGNFSMSFDRSLPAPILLRADKDGFLSGTVPVARSEFMDIEIVLKPVGGNVIEIDKGLTHLGNARYQGDINSRFQKPEASGQRYQSTFEMGAAQLPPQMGAPVLKMIVKGSQASNPVYVNGYDVGDLPLSKSDGSASEIEMPVDVCYLVEGNNKLEIVANDTDNGDLDDFEIANIRLEMDESRKSLIRSAEKETSVKDLFAELSVGGKAARTISLTDNFWVMARGWATCELLKDTIEVTLLREGADQIKILDLVETTPDSNIFRSAEPLSGHELGFEDGEGLLLTAEDEERLVRFIRGPTPDPAPEYQPDYDPNEMQIIEPEQFETPAYPGSPTGSSP